MEIFSIQRKKANLRITVTGALYDMETPEGIDILNNQLENVLANAGKKIGTGDISSVEFCFLNGTKRFGNNKTATMMDVVDDCDIVCYGSDIETDCLSVFESCLLKKMIWINRWSGPYQDIFDELFAEHIFSAFDETGKHPEMLFPDEFYSKEITTHNSLITLKNRSRDLFLDQLQYIIKSKRKGSIYKGSARRIKEISAYLEQEAKAKKDILVVLIGGNPRKKTEYIAQSLEAGFNILGDKPMAIDAAGFELLKQAFNTAKEKKLLLYDIMTERFEITTILQRRLSQLPQVFGSLQKGTPANPGITMESVHYFYKLVSGNVLARPPWFMDVTQEGEGIVDVTTHLVDLVQWISFPGKVMDYKKDIKVIDAKRWPTAMSLDEFKAITRLDAFPDYLQKDVVNNSLPVYCNGEINYQIRGVNAKVVATWIYKAAEGAGDSHYSLMRGTKANLIIKQGAEQQYKPVLYIELLKDDPLYEKTLMTEIKPIQAAYPGVELKKNKKGWEIIIPEKYKEGHEAHFAQVTKQYLEYLRHNNMPAWEVPNMIAKYYVTTKGLELAKAKH